MLTAATPQPPRSSHPPPAPREEGGPWDEEEEDKQPVGQPELSHPKTRKRLRFPVSGRLECLLARMAVIAG